ncbi:unnamed protein product [Acanthoscelides obtectus]|uniref:Uncharacterized protein n=1 Tax=Acanthoscelides obtectus TaxID=200917 RepID=A0A9P0LU72_ACAOB|nr:unnamed protein product [Acanthoscelides obtectus]CAK1651473.1 hypothetical protein AOBTE_LOCUS17309 [Acanthoscelides obtectus]
MSKELLLRIGIPPFVCQKSSPSFEKSTPKQESSATRKETWNYWTILHIIPI